MTRNGCAALKVFTILCVVMKYPVSEHNGPENSPTGSEHVAQDCWSVISHLNTVARSDASKRNLAQARRAPINRRLPSSDAHSFSTPRGWQLQGNMAAFTAESGLPSAFNENSGTHRPGGLWRPWTGEDDRPGVDRVSFGNSSALTSVCASQKSNEIFLTFNPQAHSSHGNQSLAKQPKIPTFVHPVRWARASAFETRLRLFAMYDLCLTLLCFAKAVLAQVQMLWLPVPGRGDAAAQLSGPSDHLSVWRLQQRWRQRRRRRGDRKRTELNLSAWRL